MKCSLSHTNRKEIIPTRKKYPLFIKLKKDIIYRMKKGVCFFATLLILTVPCTSGATGFIPKKFTTVTSHDDVYPYRLNNTKPSNSNKKTTSTNTINSASVAPIGKRGVVKRTTNARAATNTAPARRVVERPGISAARTGTNGANNRTFNGRKIQNVEVRSAKKVGARTNKTVRANTSNYSYSSTTNTSSQRCMADYKDCMEKYCQREDTAYNRCYCSAKLAQIDSKYQNKIDSLIQEIIRLQYSNQTTSDEIKEYWDNTVGTYTSTNPWVNIENALNIDWADTQSRIRGQNAFNTGHEYCVKFLQGCSYMATNLRDAYKSEIARDCDAYEQSLQKIQNAAESVIKTYK